MKRLLATALFFLTAFTLQCETEEKFRNPLLPSGADPWSIYWDGYYYYTHTAHDKLVVWKTENIADLSRAEKKTVWIPPAGTPYSKQLWAPELHLIGEKWYLYFAADDGFNENHRIYVLENSSSDPMEGEWTFKGKVATPSDKWAIDASVFTHRDTLYMIWSGWEGRIDGRQNVYIARMENPWTISGERAMIAEPSYSWEKFGDVQRGDSTAHIEVNEGPQFLRNGEHLFIVYSANGCWTPQYGLGLLQAKDGENLIDPSSWKKFPEPVFTASPEDSVFSPGHNSFFTSPDGSENWILYHANGKPDQGCGRHRSPRAQKFSWGTDGRPVFGKPLSTRVSLDKPAEPNNH